MLLAVAAALALRLETAAVNQVGLAGHEVGKVVTEALDPAFQGVVEQIGQHGHAARHPLARTAEFGVIELRHAAVTMDHGVEHVQNGGRTEAIPLGQIVDRLLAGGKEVAS